ncbi:hypothetical protein HOLleu_39353 [Holothuria leucospilota]|uniref:Uncharacterized protein n=1 Tax=Holothuria leucospilota TaxID=206669 RepID=A0A9Q1BET4_HOLLE|nr:hypothetical protein HOLleu_39353 [Holothuria leucospilota]
MSSSCLAITVIVLNSIPTSEKGRNCGTFCIWHGLSDTKCATVLHLFRVSLVSVKAIQFCTPLTAKQLIFIPWHRLRLSTYLPTLSYFWLLEHFISLHHLKY